MASRTAQFSPRAESHQQGHASMSITEHAVQVISQMRTNVESQVGSVQQFLARTLIDIEEQENETWQKDQKLREAERKIERLEAENRNLRSQLPNIVPDCQLSDASLKSEIIAIQENISNWAEDLPDVIGFPRVFEDTMRRLNMEIRMHSGLDEFPQQPFGAQPEILTFVTFEILWNSLFRELFSLKPFDSGFLQELRSKKRWSRAEHEIESSIMWMSSTVRDYVSLPQHKFQLEAHLAQLSADIRSFHQALYRGIDFNYDHRFTRLDKQILKPVSDLMVKMSCSPESYRWDWYDQASRSNRVLKEHLDLVVAMDAQTHNKISRKVLDRFSERQELGTLLLVIFPALYRRGRKREQDVLINRATVLIRVDNFEPRAAVETDSTGLFRR